jgi:hypothetical protein
MTDDLGIGSDFDGEYSEARLNSSCLSFIILAFHARTLVEEWDFLLAF